MGVGLTGGIIVGLGIDIHLQNVKEAEAKMVTATTTPKEVMIEVVIDWEKPGRIKEEIETVFSEAPGTALAVAKCESSLKMVQSHHQQPYGRERSFGVFQIHEPDWADDAARLGLDNWRTDPGENIKLARYIYDSAGKSFKPWSCYSKRMI